MCPPHYIVASAFSFTNLPTARAQGGLGDLAYPLVSDLKREVSSAYGVLNKVGGEPRVL